MNYSEVDIDVLIIGAGGSGLRAAIELDKTDLDVMVVGKREFGDAHTVKAAGGINASLANLDSEDNWKIHAADTLREGGFINDPGAVELLCKNVPARVKELQEWGCDFNLTDAGKIDQRYFGAQSFRRTCFVGDETGQAIEETLVGVIKETDVSHQQGVIITKLLTDDDKVVGAIGYRKETGEVLLFKTSTVLLAAGGYTQLYNRSSSRSHENTGDGPALAFDAGASLQDMEMVQFHPTGMVKPQEKLGSLVTEAVRGEGGRLFNADEERFMEAYSPKKMELDARDQVARAIYRELEKGHGTEAGGVYLDISHENSDLIRERLPAIVEKFQKVGVDPTSEKMEVAPTTHYSMGGVRINFNTGETGVDGLFAVGEATAGLHGANRLGGNSLAEVVTFGQLFSDSLRQHARRKTQPSIPDELVETGLNEIEELHDGKGNKEPSTLFDELGDILWEDAGIIRTEEELRKGLDKLRELKEKSRELAPIPETDSEKFETAVELKFAIPVAESIIRSALKRKESRGAHYREDYPQSRENWQKNVVVTGTPDSPRIEVRETGEISVGVQRTLKEGYELEYHHLE